VEYLIEKMRGANSYDLFFAAGCAWLWSRIAVHTLYAFALVAGAPTSGGVPAQFIVGSLCAPT